MQVRVLFFGVLKDVLGRSDDLVSIPEGATVADVVEHYGRESPRLKQFLPSVALSVNQEYAAPTSVLHDRDEVALLPPVSGGADAVEPALGCAITHERIATESIVNAIKRATDGAVVVFEGIVRDHTRGRRTLFLDYEAYEPMALAQLRSLISDARQNFAIRDAVIVHRTGRLEIGETSVLIVVASAHRAAAFDACRWLIDTLKRSVPIWKKEHFADGAVWADGEPFPPEVARADPTEPQS